MPSQPGPWLHFLPQGFYMPFHSFLIPWEKTCRRSPFLLFLLHLFLFSLHLLLPFLFPRLTLHPSCDCPSFKPKHSGHLWRMSAWLLLGPQRGQFINLSRVISAQAQVAVFLINEAYVIYCETIEEYPSHSSECVTEVIMRWPSLSRGDQVFKPYLTIVFQKHRLGGRGMETSKTWVWPSEQISLSYVLCP